MTYYDNNTGTHVSLQGDVVHRKARNGRKISDNLVG